MSARTPGVDGRLAHRLVLLAGAAAALAGCVPGSLQQSHEVVVGRSDGGLDTAGPHVPGPCLQPAADPALARFQNGVVGHWAGTATTPDGWAWSWATVEFTFFCDGHYQGRCLAAEGVDPASCVALYNGTDDDDPHKTYAIDDVRADGTAIGDIVVYFPTATTTHDILDAIDLGLDGNTLSFDLIHLEEYGPVHYELVRAP
jgi:hypothetical protein